MIDPRVHVDYDRADSARSPEQMLWRAVVARLVRDCIGENCTSAEQESARRFLFQDSEDLALMTEFAGLDLRHARRLTAAAIQRYADAPRERSGRRRDKSKPARRTSPEVRDAIARQILSGEPFNVHKFAQPAPIVRNVIDYLRRNGHQIDALGECTFVARREVARSPKTSNDSSSAGTARRRGPPMEVTNV